MKAIIKQPIVHFLLAGALIFTAYSFNAEETTAPQGLDKVIEVDRTALLNFMQYRSRAFQPELFNQRFEDMAESDRQDLIEDYVREEALHREALAMGMDQGDYIIRQRLVQKVEFLLENMVNASLDPTEEDFRAFYEARRDDYRVDAIYTFTHVFFDAEERGRDAALADAGALLADPVFGQAGFNDASQYGDRYPFLQNYVERTRDFVANNFTERFVDELDRIPVDPAAWQGPFESRYGYHLVMLRQRSEPYIPPQEDIQGRVLDDYRYETVLEQRLAAEQQVVSGYTVNINL